MHIPPCPLNYTVMILNTNARHNTGRFAFIYFPGEIQFQLTKVVTIYKLDHAIERTALTITKETRYDFNCSYNMLKMIGRLPQLRDSEMDLAIDELIRPAVDLLRKYGIETIESCQGGEGHACLEPMVRFTGDEIDIIRAMDICIAHGMYVSEGRKVYRKIEDITEADNWQKNIGQTYERPTNIIVFKIHPKTGTIYLPS